MVLLDTHAWVWGIENPGKLGRKAGALLTNRSSWPHLVSVISVWEVAKLVEKRRLALAIAIDKWIEQALAAPGIALEMITPEVAVESTRLPGSFQSDPADQIIVATARSLNVPIVTSDLRIRKYPHVRTVW